MNYLVPAFLGEGPTDRPFLEPVVRRVLQDILGSDAFVEIQAFLPIKPKSRGIGDVCDEVCKRLDEFDLLVVHTDGKGDPARAQRERVQPIRAVVPQSKASCVGIVPVHETEAWALVDGDALRWAFEVRYSNEEMKLPRIQDLERENNPKAVLRNLMQRVRGRSRRRTGLPLGSIAERVSLDCLRKLSAFRQFEVDLRGSLDILKTR